MLIFITHIVKKTVKDEYGYATIAGLFGLFFGVFFAIVESFFYGYAYGLTYWIRGIPFDILHGVSNFIIVLILFNPITKIMIYVYEGFNS
jgi:energy-coupling factor transport system substrate-specific component